MFKNAMFYRVTCPKTQAILNDWEELTALLENKPAYLPTGSQWRALGFDAAVASLNDHLVYSGPGNTNLFCVYVHERMLPGATIREHVAARCKKIEDRESRKCYAKEKAQIRDEVMAELLPKAFIKHSYIQMLVVGDLLVIDTSSAKKAEDALSLLREAMGSLPVRPVSYKVGTDFFLTEVVRSNRYDFLDAGHKAKLVNSDGDVVAVKGLDLEDDEVQAHLVAGFKATEVQILLNDQHGTPYALFMLNDKLVFKGIKVDESHLGTVKTESDGDAAAYFDASLVLLTGMLQHLIAKMDAAIGEVVYEKKEAYTPPAAPCEFCGGIEAHTPLCLTNATMTVHSSVEEYQSPDLSQAEQQEAVEEEDDDTFATANEDEDDDL